MEKNKQVERKAIYSIIERKGAKDYWLQVGTAFVNADGSLNLLLNVLPLDGKLHVRDFAQREERDAA